MCVIGYKFHQFGDNNRHEFLSFEKHDDPLIGFKACDNTKAHVLCYHGHMDYVCKRLDIP